jgi:acyl-CoA thioester hydrolase
MGVVYNGNYITYFETGRTELMRRYGLPYTFFEENGIMLPVIESFVQYKTSAYYDDVLTIEAKIKLEMKATARFEYRILRGEELIATGYTLHSYLSAETRKAVRPPQFWVDAMKKFLNEE